MLPLIEDEFFDEEEVWRPCAARPPLSPLAFDFEGGEGFSKTQSAKRQLTLKQAATEFASAIHCGKVALFVFLGFAAVFALCLGLGLGLQGSSSSNTTPTVVTYESLIVTVGPTGRDSQNRPVLNPAGARCALAQATGLSLKSFVFTSYQDSTTNRLTAVTPNSPLNAAVSCSSLGYSNVTYSRRLASVVTNTSLSATQANINFQVPLRLVQTVVNEIMALATSDPGFAVLFVTIVGNGTEPGPPFVPTPSTSPSITPSVTASSSVTPSFTPSTSVSPSVTGSRTVSSSVSASTTVSPSRTASVSASRTVSPSISASSTVSASRSATASATRSVQATSSASATVTPTSLPSFVRITAAVPNSGVLSGPLAAVPVATTNNVPTFFFGTNNAASTSASTTTGIGYAQLSGSTWSYQQLYIYSASAPSYISAISFSTTSSLIDSVWFGACTAGVPTVQWFGQPLSNCAGGPTTCANVVTFASLGNGGSVDCTNGRATSVAWSNGAGSIYYTTVSSGHVYINGVSTGVPTSDRGVASAVFTDPNNAAAYFLLMGPSPSYERSMQQVSWSGAASAYVYQTVVALTSLFPNAASYVLTGGAINWSSTKAYVTFTSTTSSTGGIIIVDGLNTGTVTASFAANPPLATPFSPSLLSSFSPGGIAMVPTSSSTAPDQVVVVDVTDGQRAVWIGTPSAQ